MTIEGKLSLRMAAWQEWFDIGYTSGIAIFSSGGDGDWFFIITLLMVNKKKWLVIGGDEQLSWIINCRYTEFSQADHFR